MKPTKYLAMLVAAGSLAYPSLSRAQFGYGMWGGMQQCPYGYGAADGATDAEDEIQQCKEDIKDLKETLREEKKRLRDLEQRKDKYAEVLNSSLTRGWADVVRDHLESGYSCYCEPPPEQVYPIEYPDDGGGGCNTCQPAPQPQPQPQPQPSPQPPTEPQVEPPPPPKPTRGKSSADIFEPNKKFATRMPANETSGPAPTGGGNPWDSGLGAGGGYSMGGGGPSCAPPSPMTTSRRWKEMYCGDGGDVRSGICRDPMIASAESRRHSSECERALREYRRVYHEAEKTRNMIAGHETELEQKNEELSELRRDLRRELRDNRKLEADCPTGECNRPRRHAERGPSTLSVLAPLAMGALMGVGMEAAGYFLNKDVNSQRQKLGWPAQPHAFGSYGYPFIRDGIYGAAMAGVNGGFGCSTGMGGGGPFGPYGMGGPFGYSLGPYGMMNSPFGYPNMFGMPMGGGMYMPGMGPWGMSGPWGNGPYMGMGGGFGMPMGGGFGMGGGLGGGFGMPMGGGFGMGMPFGGLGTGFGMPMGGGFGMGGGLGMPYGGGLGGGFGMPMGGMGIGGGFGMPFGSGFGTPYAGYGLGGGFGSPFGGYGLNGYPGMAGGGMFGSPYGMYGMQGAYMQNMMANQRAYYGLQSELNSSFYRLNQLQTGMGGSAYPYGGMGGGFGLGGGFGVGGGFGGMMPYGGYGLGGGFGMGPGLGGSVGPAPGNYR